MPDADIATLLAALQQLISQQTADAAAAGAHDNAARTLTRFMRFVWLSNGGLLRKAEGHAMDQMADGEGHGSSRDHSNLLKGRTGRATARALTSSLKLPSLNDFLSGAGLQHSTADFKNAGVTVNMLILKVSRHARTTATAGGSSNY